MSYKRIVLTSVAAFAVVSAGIASAQTDKKADPYTQGADRKADTYEYLQKQGDKFDPYTQGANNSTANALNPGVQTGNVQNGKYDPYSQGARAGDVTSPYTQGASAGDATSHYTQGSKATDPYTDGAKQ